MKYKRNIFWFIVAVIIVVVGISAYYAWPGKSWSTYANDTYKVSLQYPSGWEVVEEDTNEDPYNLQVFFSTTEQTDPANPNPLLTLRVYKPGQLRMGTRDWKNIRIGQNEFAINCGVGNVLDRCEILDEGSREFLYVIYLSNPDSDPVSKKILSSFHAE